MKAGYQPGLCVLCNDVIIFRRGNVPTFSDANTPRGPVCEKCVKGVNMIREEDGIEQISVPEGTYLIEAPS